jgi:competence protein ComEC
MIKINDYNNLNKLKIDNLTIKIIDKYNDDSYICKYKNNKLIIYFKNDYKLGDYVKITGVKSEIKEPNLKYLFNYKEYLKYQKIKLIVYSKYDYKIKSGFSHLILNYKIKEFIDNNFNYKTSEYLNVLLINNDNDFNEITRNKINTLSASHLLCISGLHLSLFISLIQIVNKIFKLKEDKLNLLICIFLSIYCVIVNFSYSVLRVSLVFILKYIFDKKKIEFSSLDILSLVGIIILILNNYALFSLSFQLSFLVSFGLILSNEYLNKLNIFKSLIMITIISNLITLPIIINLNNQINLISIIANLVLVIYFSYLFLPLSFGLLLFPFLEKFYLYLIFILEKIIDFFYKIDWFIIKIPSIDVFEKIILIIIVYNLLRGLYDKSYLKVYIPIFILFFIANSLKVNIRNNNEIIFFDIGQGDSSYYNYNGCSMLIDFYGSNYEYIYKKGIFELDYLVLTHGHDDHYSDLEKLLKSFKINNIMISYYDNTDIIKDIYKYQKKYKYNIVEVKSGDCVQCNKTSIKILNPLENSNNLNNISIVFKLPFYEYSILYTGDMEKDMEEKLVNKYKGYLKSDILKVGHHGSNTSSSENFIKYVNPKLSVISLKENNKFGFPSKEVINRLNYYDSNILITSIHQNVVVNYKNINKLIKK